MTDRVLQEVDRVRREARSRYAGASIDHVRQVAEAASPARSLAEALSHDELALIVEPRRAASGRIYGEGRGDIADVAREAEGAGARALSIITEPTFAHGRIGDVARARGACDLPVLARDFVVHAGQLYELRAAGADAVMLPMFAFGERDDEDDQPEVERLESIVDRAHALGMEVVPSVQDERELEWALTLETEMLNIDNRDRVGDGSIDVERTFDLLAHVPVGTTVISESVAEGGEVARLHRAGVDALLLDEGHLDGHDLAARIEMFSRLAASN